MDTTMRATCPNCRSTLKIPVAWAGHPVKCKKCGAVVRTKAAAATPAANGHVPAATVPSPFADLAPAGRPAPAAYNPFEAPSGTPPVAYDPTAYPSQPGYGPAPVQPATAHPVAAPAYPQPAVSSAVAAALGSQFQPSEATQAKTGGRRKYRQGSGRAKYAWLGVALLVMAGMVAGAIYAVPVLKAKFGTPVVEGNGNAPGEPTKGAPNANPNRSGLVGGGVFPRRLLFIHVSNYLYLNPLTASTQIGTSVGADKTRAAALRLAYEWRVPVEKDNNQVFVLSDTAPPPDARTPFKDVLTGTYEKFFDTSRGQDRIVVYFGGHVVTKKADDKTVTYLVPVEGDPDDAASLVPLDDFYAKLKDCKATQKVVVWDVCRFNPQRGRQRPGSEPMTAETAAALAAAPPGVQVVTTCQGGENALEFNALQVDGRNDFVGGSNFLEAGKYVTDKQKGAKTLAPNDPLPVEAWAAAVGKRANDVADQSTDKAKQTVKVSGAAPDSLVAFAADEPPAPRFDFPTPPKGAPEGEVKSVETELALPGIKADGNDLAVGSLPYPADTFVAYKTDVPLSEIMKPENAKKYRFRVTVVKAFETIRSIWGGNGAKMRNEFTDKSSDAIKKKILNEQEYPANAIPRLDREIFDLEAVEPTKADQPKRWQAHFDYALAQCKARLAFMHEYNLALGSIRTDVMPTLDPKKNEDGYRLISTEKMRIKTEKKSAEEAKEIFERLIEEHKGTPWAILAKRDKSMILGLAWQPFSSTAAQAEADEMKDKN